MVRSLAVRLFVAFALAFLTLYAYWGINLYRSMDAQIHQRAETLMEERRTYIRALVESAVNAAEHHRRTIEARLRRVIRERVKRALDVAENIWRNRAPDATEADVRAAIREALRPLRFDGGRGYFYVFDMETGEGILHAAMPELEGTDLRDVRDPDGRPIVPRMIDMLREKREGYYTYFWSHPNKPGERHLKVAYSALFEPLGWGIACGDYVDDMTADIKAETLAQLEAIHFGNDGYIFAGTWDGRSLLGPAQGQTVWAVEDPNGVKVVQHLAAAARAGGGFVSYVVPITDEDLEPQHKLSYVLPVPEWEWYVGAGVSIDDINASIAEIGAVMRRDALNDLILGTALMALMAAASYLIALQSARRVGAEVRRLETFLEDDGRHPEVLNPDDARFGESRRLAIAVRAMAARRDAAEAALERQTESLEKSNADLERFAYVASHDLREPLRIISSYVGLLRRRYRGRLDADADTFIDYAADGAQRMHDMIGDLLEYARVKTSDTPFATVPLDRVLDQARSNLTRRIREIDAMVEIPDGLPSVRGKESLLVSLFQNLLENALKYRHPDRRPQVRVSSRIEAEACVMSVTDNGLGIDPAFHDRIFRIFQRLHPGGTYPGTGVGLSICQSIAETHDGRIWVDSEPDIGSAFHVSLPLATQGSAGNGEAVTR
ncbi:cache domain-containing protein [uncultured Rhodospira sp.]|uniref:cache domain-containing protein n=1 Tax=uncultured Rhodospira sp. TaxID=1936189 RepID=UPI00261541A2|nr:cache domain-containing protein [uncultured Rhodospira sp.]